MKKKIVVAVLVALLAAAVAVLVKAGTANATYHDTKASMATTYHDM